ncbi:MAG: TylF/MycF/NovP-related O-methyltransferase [Pseudomonadota bacterium]
MKAVLRKLLDTVGLRGAAQRVKRWLHARGWVRWEPLVPHDAFSESCDQAIASLRAADHQFGDYLEFGVSRGTAMACMHHALRRAGLGRVRVFGFDSFEGMPEESAGQGWRPGLYASTIGATRAYLREAGVDMGGVTLTKGWFKDTLTEETKSSLGLGRASLILLDCDIYSATKEALWFCEPLIGDETVLIFDDWGWQADKGEIGQREAFREFLDTFPQFQIAQELPGYIPQARIFRVARIPGADESPRPGALAAE